MEQGIKQKNTFTRQEIEQHLQSALAAATPDVWSKLDLSVPQEPAADRQGPVQISIPIHMQSRFDGQTGSLKSKLLRLERRFGSLGAAAAAVFCLLAVGGGYYHYEYVQVASRVEIDVNPSLRLSLNRRERVLQAEALNEDGAALVDGRLLKGQPVEQAVGQVVDSLLENGYLQKDGAEHAVLVSVSGRNEAKAEQLKETVAANVESTLSQREVTAVVYDQVIQVTKELEELAQTYQVSPGKAEFIGQLVNENESLSQDQQEAYARMMGQTMEELAQEIDVNAYQVSKKVTIIRTEPVTDHERSAERSGEGREERSRRSEESRGDELQFAAGHEDEGTTSPADGKTAEPNENRSASDDEGKQELIPEKDQAVDGNPSDREEKAAQTEAADERQEAPKLENALWEARKDEKADAAEEAAPGDGSASDSAGEVTEDRNLSADESVSEVIEDENGPTDESASEAAEEERVPESESAGEATEEDNIPTDESVAGVTEEENAPADGTGSEVTEEEKELADETGSEATEEEKAPTDESASEAAEEERAPESESAGEATEEENIPTDESASEPIEEEKEPADESASEPSEADSDTEMAEDQEEAAEDSKDSMTDEKQEPEFIIDPETDALLDLSEGPGVFEELEDGDEEEETGSRIIHSSSSIADNFEPGDMVSRKESGSTVTSSGTQIIFETVEKKEWKEPVYASEFLSGSERRLLQKGPGIFSGNASEEDQETILRFGPGFAAFGQSDKNISSREGNVFFERGFLGLRVRPMNGRIYKM